MADFESEPHEYFTPYANMLDHIGTEPSLVFDQTEAERAIHDTETMNLLERLSQR